MPIRYRRMMESIAWSEFFAGRRAMVRMGAGRTTQKTTAGPKTCLTTFPLMLGVVGFYLFAAEIKTRKEEISREKQQKKSTKKMKEELRARTPVRTPVTC